MHILIWGVIFLSALGLSGCANDPVVYAPVSDAASIEKIPPSGSYRIQPGDTLYSIAWRYGLDYNYLASRNNITSPYHIVVGEVIYLRGKPATPASKKAPLTTIIYAAPSAVPKAIHPPVLEEQEPNKAVSYWRWPVRGKIMGGFGEFNKGINIGGRLGMPIYATAPGKVVYSGNGLRSYGNLIIIKHNSVFLSAYAHNSITLVKEGDWVKGGQKIAEMGHSGTRRVMLHFEIRRRGQPVNPLNYLVN